MTADEKLIVEILTLIGDHADKYKKILKTLKLKLDKDLNLTWNNW